MKSSSAAIKSLWILLCTLFILGMGASSAFAVCTDLDGDGYGYPGSVDCPGGSLADCDDTDPARFPGNPEICDGKDNDCNNKLPFDERDTDKDGVSICQGDCNDYDPRRFPGNVEICGDRVDNDCDGAIDAADPQGCICPDQDGDGFQLAVCGGTDCDDTNPNIYPGAPEICDDGIDNNCDTKSDCADTTCATFPTCVACVTADVDGDGYSTAGGVCGPIDCDDADANVHPGAPEVCDGKDSNCDGYTPGNEVDADGDGSFLCSGDCDDNDPNRYPGATELCNGIDDNCDYKLPFNERDTDRDGVPICAGDCNDYDPRRFPGNVEICSDRRDNNCNGLVDEAGCVCPDADGDGFTDPVCGGTDCDDTNPNVYPGAPEICDDGVDNNCDSKADCADSTCATFPACVACVAADLDGDGYSTAGGVCGPIDCDDTDAGVYPGALEVCDGKDSNCDGYTPGNEVDADGDGAFLCSNDCDDNDPTRYPGAVEICDGKDNDCNFSIPFDELDQDGDGWMACAGDCQPFNAAINPGVPETPFINCSDGIDNNCDGVDTPCDTSSVNFPTDVQPIFDANCINCHNTGGTAPDLTAGNSYAAIVNQAAAGCAGQTYVIPSDSVNSYLVHKILQDGIAPACGAKMPTGSTGLPASVSIVITSWIDQGATPSTTCTDNDGDGYGFPGNVNCPNGAAEDCNDANAAVHPGAAELCTDTVDNNCNGLTDCLDTAACSADPACAGGTPAIGTDVTSINFGVVNLGNIGTASVVVSNTGTADLTLSGMSTGNAVFTFGAGAPALPLVLTPGANATIPLDYTPVAAGTDTGTLTLTSDAANGPATVSLTGSGNDPNATVPYADIQAIFNANCTGCHGGASPTAGLDLTAGCDNLHAGGYVAPNNSAASLLYQKVAPGGSMAGNLTAAEAVKIGAWIDQGAVCPCIDGDLDGYGSNAAGIPTDCTNAGLDCNDANAAINPGATEICDNTIDDNCDTLADCGDPTCSTFPACSAVPVLGTDVTSINFGVVTIPASGNANVVVTSTGTADVTITAITTNNGVFATSGVALPLTLIPGATATVTVTFTPVAGGVQSGTMTISSNASNDPVTVSLTGEGFDPNAPVPYTDVQAIFNSNCISCHSGASPSAGLDLSASCDNLITGGYVLAGNSAGSLLYQKVSTGTMSSKLTTAQTQTIGTWIDQGANCPCIDGDGDGYGTNVTNDCPNVGVDCNDTNAAVNPGATEVCDNTIDDNCDNLADCGDPTCSTFPACAAVPVLGTDVSSINFGVVTIPASGTANVVMTSTGTATVNITSITTDNGVFTTSGVSLPLALAPGGTATVTVTFTPVAGGIVSGTMTINSDAPVVTVSLTGEGFDPNAPVPYTDVQAIFDANCISCHSGASPSAGLDLTLGCQNLISGNYVVSGNSAGSLLYQKVSTGTMSSKLTTAQAQTIGTWIDQGANCTCIDADGDGYGTNVTTDCPNSGVDCNDANAAINPGATEVCDDTIDNNCNNLTDCADTAACSTFPACAAVSTITTDVASISFGQVTVGASGNGPVVVSNVGTADLTISALNTDNVDFAASGITLPYLLAAGANVTVTVTYTPSADGADTGTLTIVSDAGNGNATVALTGTGCADADGDGVTTCAGDCNDNDPNIYPGAPEILGNFIDDDCDPNTLDDGGTNTGTPPAPHNGITCTNCHLSNFATKIPDSQCNQCHTPGGALKGSYPTAVDVLAHTDANGSGNFVYTNACVDCHNPMATGLNNLKLLRSVFSGSVIPGSVTNLTAFTGAGSFADGTPYEENVCETCHSQTNHHQADGTAPGNQSHHDTQDCTQCHRHANAFVPDLPTVPAPHNAFACTVCHVTPDTYVTNAPIPNTACGACHDAGAPNAAAGGADTKVIEHYSSMIDPLTGQPTSLNCVECHNPMSTQINFRNNTNLKFIRSVIRGSNVAFEALTGPYSFADDATTPVDMTPANYLCDTCHTQTNHHQNDGTAPGVQTHHDGENCTACHAHIDGFNPALVTPPPPHSAVTCTDCHVTPDTYVTNAAIPNTACLGCHDPAAPGTASGGSDLKVDRHFSNKYIDPTTGVLADLNCVECHNPMSLQTNFRGNTNLKFIRSMVRGSSVAFEATTGQYSFADDSNMPVDMTTANYVCNTCHTQTNHHQSGGTAPGGQSHNDGVDCTGCHGHDGGFQPTTTDCLACHNSSPPAGSTDPNRRQIVEGTPGDGAGDFVRTSHHVNDGTALQIVTQNDCQICHDQSSHQTLGDPNVLLNDQDGGASYAYNGMAASAENFCLSCHDGNHPTPFPSDNNSPPNIENGWLTSQHKASGQATCLNCHAQGHGSDFAKLLVQANEPGLCFNCHGAAGPGPDIQSEFAKTYGHPVTASASQVQCLDCHNPHEAQAGTHTAGNPAIAGVLKGVSGADGSSASNWPSTGNPPHSNFSYTTVSTPTREYQVCYRCHSYFNTGVTGMGGTGAASLTDVGLEFNPANKSYHPVVQALPSSQRLTNNQLTGGWSPGDTMTCSDCHANNAASPKGPHGSNTKWMLTGNNTAWPYTSASSNGTSSGTLATLNSPGNNLFCRNCHPDTGKNGNQANKVHEKGNHKNAACAGCHIRVPHGGKVSRLMAANRNNTLPPRYYPNGNGGGTLWLKKFTRSTDPTNYSKSYCYSTISACNKHNNSGNGSESW